MPPGTQFHALVVQRQLFVQFAPGTQRGHHLDLHPVAAELAHDLVDGGYRGAVPEREFPEVDGHVVYRLSRMDALQQQAMAQNAQRRAAQSLGRIEAALRRCDDGSYGFCIDCDEAIDPRRLNLDPAATRCIRCAEAHDG